MKTITISYKTKTDVVKCKNILAVNLISHSKVLTDKGCYSITILN